MKGKFLVGVKRTLSKVPPSIGRVLSNVPFQYRLGSSYLKFRHAEIGVPSPDSVFLMMKEIVESAYLNVPFYRGFYARHGFLPSDLHSYEDLNTIPIVKKSDLKEYGLSDRAIADASGIVTNTGGTSGQPLGLMLDSGAYAREWGHMHTVWERLGYKTSDMKLTLRGMNLGSEPIVYNFIHNEFQINAYCEFDRIIFALKSLLEKYTIKYIHGYPSSIYDLVNQLSLKYPDVLSELKKSLEGVFLGSEYPAPIYRDYIEKGLGVRSISWYGHSEMAVLAGEKEERFVYYPFHSYGYAEAVAMGDGIHLVGTTIHNFVSPLIRYDTEDVIEPISIKAGVLESFRVSKGRQGEFVLDKNSRRISLTALVFGRHHRIFEIVDFVQVSQLIHGEMTVWVTSKCTGVSWEEYFDSDDVSIDIRFEVVSSPFKTASGKVPLLVNGFVN